MTIKECTFNDENIYIKWNDNHSDIDESVIPIGFLVKNYPEDNKKDNKKTFEFTKVWFSIKFIEKFPFYASFQTIKSFDYKDFYIGEEKNKDAIHKYFSRIIFKLRSFK